MHRRLFFAGFLALAACKPRPEFPPAASLANCAPKPEGDPQWMSLIALIADPEKYSGRYIGLQGYFTVGAHGARLYRDEHSADAAYAEESVFLRFGGDDLGKLGDRFAGRMVQVEGVFNASTHGWAADAGSLESIQSIGRATSMKQPEDGVSMSCPRPGGVPT